MLSTMKRLEHNLKTQREKEDQGQNKKTSQLQSQSSPPSVQQPLSHTVL